MPEHTHEHKSLDQEILDIVNLRKDPNFQTYGPIKRFLLLTAEILEAGCELAHTVEDKEVLIGTLERLYDMAAQEIDLPFIDDQMELLVEMAGRQLIRPVMTAVYNKINPRQWGYVPKTVPNG